MFAINHAATALLVKRKFPEAPTVWLLISVQLMELFWVIFNYFGLEKTTTETIVQGHDGDPNGRPTLAFARLRITLSGTTPAGQIRLWVTGRDRSEG